WAACLLLGTYTLAFVLGIDPIGSIFGRYQYRQGLLTQWAYILVFFGAYEARAWTSMGTLLAGAAAGLTGVGLYAGIQVFGFDPIEWGWVDTSSRAIGTIGNANELAAYAVLGLAACAFVPRDRPRGRAAAIAVVTSAATFSVLASESRG